MDGCRWPDHWRDTHTSCRLFSTKRTLGKRSERRFDTVRTWLGTLLREDGVRGQALPAALRAGGRALYFLNRDEETLADFSRALALAPDDRQADSRLPRRHLPVARPIRGSTGRLRPGHRPRPRLRLGNRQPRQHQRAPGPCQRGAGGLQPGHRPRL